EGLGRGAGVRAEDTIDLLRRDVPLAGSAIREHRLQTTHDRAGRSFPQDRHWCAVRQVTPGERADDPVNGETASLLELLHRHLRLRPEDAVDGNPGVGRTSERSLQPFDDVPARSATDRGLTWVRHGSSRLV